MSTDFAHSLLSDPEYFQCERMRCVMRKTACVERQKPRRISGNRDADAPQECAECPQGAAIAEERAHSGVAEEQHSHSADIIAMTKAMRERAELAGHIFQRTPHHGDDDEPQERVVQQSTAKEKVMGNQTKLCKRCGKEKTLEEFDRHPSCSMGRAPACKECRKQDYRAKHAPGKGKKPVNYVSEEERAAIASVSLPAAPDTDATITLDFKGHEKVLEWVSQTAAANFRNPDQQVLYVLHQVSASRKRA